MTGESDDDIMDSVFHNADSRIMPPEPRLFGSAAHFASRLI
jgi:hypothetical protein